MSHLLPNVPPASAESDEEANEIIGAPAPQLEPDAMGFKKQATGRVISENEVFPDKAPPPPVVHHVQPTTRAKRKVSQKQLEHLAKARVIAAAKRANRKSVPQAPVQAPPVQEVPDTSDADMYAFAESLIDRYEERRSVRKSARQPAKKVEQAPVPPPQPSQADIDYAFYSKYF